MISLKINPKRKSSAVDQSPYAGITRIRFIEYNLSR
jgi:hypothetical protein